MAEESRGQAPLEKKLKKKQKVPLPPTGAEPAAELDLDIEVKKVKKAKKVEPETDTAATEDKTSKKRKKPREEEAEQPTEKAPDGEENERRNAQREIQQLVVRLRAEGKSKHEIEAAKLDLKRGIGKSFRKPDNARTKKTEAWKQRQVEAAAARPNKAATDKATDAEKTKEGEKAVTEEDEEAEETADAKEARKKAKKLGEEAEPKSDGASWRENLVKGKDLASSDPWKEARREGLEHKHDIVVIPVIWRGRQDHQDIEKACSDVKSFLAQQGLDVWVDSRRHYTPGQKFAHWEFRGVMSRIEIGPEDFTAGILKLCRMPPGKEAGDYKSVEKKRLRLPPRGSRKLLLALKEWGFDKIEIERRASDDNSDDEEVEEMAIGAKSSARETADEDDVGGNWKPRVSLDERAAKKTKKRRTA